MPDIVQKRVKLNQKETPYLLHDTHPFYLVIFVGGKKGSLLRLPFPIFDLVHMQYSTSALWYRWAAVCPNSFYLVTDITDEKDSCYPNSSLPGTF